MRVLSSPAVSNVTSSEPVEKVVHRAALSYNQQPTEEPGRYSILPTPPQPSQDIMQSSHKFVDFGLDGHSPMSSAVSTPKSTQINVAQVPTVNTLVTKNSPNSVSSLSGFDNSTPTPGKSQLYFKRKASVRQSQLRNPIINGENEARHQVPHLSISTDDLNSSKFQLPSFQEVYRSHVLREPLNSTANSLPPLRHDDRDKLKRNFISDNRPQFNRFSSIMYDADYQGEQQAQNNESPHYDAVRYAGPSGPNLYQRRKVQNQPQKFRTLDTREYSKPYVHGVSKSIRRNPVSYKNTYNPYLTSTSDYSTSTQFSPYQQAQRPSPYIDPHYSSPAQMPYSDPDVQNTGYFDPNYAYSQFPSQYQTVENTRRPDGLNNYFPITQDNNGYIEYFNPPPEFEAGYPSPVEYHDNTDASSSNFSPHPNSKRMKPPHPYPYLIAEAILASPESRLTLSGVYRALSSRYPSSYNFPNQSAECARSWKNTVRYNLSRSGIFRRLSEEEAGRGGKQRDPEDIQRGPGRRQAYWEIVPKIAAEFRKFGLDSLLEVGDARKSRRIYPVGRNPKASSQRPEHNAVSPTVAQSEVFSSPSFNGLKAYRPNDIISADDRNPLGANNMFHMPYFEPYSSS